MKCQICLKNKSCKQKHIFDINIFDINILICYKCILKIKNMLKFHFEYFRNFIQDL